MGFYSIYAAKIHKNIDVVSFEPSSSNLRILSRNISINNLEDKIGINTLPLGIKTLNFLFLERVNLEKVRVITLMKKILTLKEK